MTRRITFVTRGGRHRLGRRSDIVHALEQLGVEVDVRPDGEVDPGDDPRWILLRGTAGWFPRTVRRVREGDSRARVLLWLTEPLPPLAASGLRASRLSLRDATKLVLRDARANDQRTNLRQTLALMRDVPGAVVAASTRAKVETLAERGLAVPLVPLGVPVTVEIDVRPEADRDVDVLFVGDLNVPHRRRALRRLRREGIEVDARGDWRASRGLWGEEREELLRRTKILLNLSRHPGNYADSRLGLGAAAGAVVASEPLYGAEPWVAGVHYEEAPLDVLPGLIRELLRDDERRRRVAAAAAELAREHTLRESARGLLALMDGDAAA